jgi:hypothetical protein
MSTRKSAVVQSVHRMPKSEPVTVRMPVAMAKKLRERAAADRRTLSNWLMLKLEKIADEATG